LKDLYTADAVLAAFSASEFDAIILSIQQQAFKVQDFPMIVVCSRALCGSSRARRKCARLVAEANLAASKN
jgi:hypothetical protein